MQLTTRDVFQCAMGLLPLVQSIALIESAMLLLLLQRRAAECGITLIRFAYCFFPNCKTPCFFTGVYGECRVCSKRFRCHHTHVVSKRNDWHDLDTK